MLAIVKKDKSNEIENPINQRREQNSIVSIQKINWGKQSEFEQNEFLGRLGHVVRSGVLPCDGLNRR